MRGDLVKTTADPFRETGVDEVLLREFGQSILVKGVLKVFEGEGIVENIDICFGDEKSFKIGKITG
jgi:hypothetical protein